MLDCSSHSNVQQKSMTTQTPASPLPGGGGVWWGSVCREAPWRTDQDQTSSGYSKKGTEAASPFAQVTNCKQLQATPSSRTLARHCPPQHLEKRRHKRHECLTLGLCGSGFLLESHLSNTGLEYVVRLWSYRFRFYTPRSQAATTTSQGRQGARGHLQSPLVEGAPRRSSFPTDHPP